MITHTRISGPQTWGEKFVRGLLPAHQNFDDPSWWEPPAVTLDKIKTENERLREALVAAKKYIEGVNADCPRGTDDDRDELLAKIETALSGATENKCHECGAAGVIDSGGITPWGSGINIPCPACESNRTSRATEKGGNG